MSTPMKLTLPRQLAYACGQAGNVLGESLITTYLLVLYLPPGREGEAARALVPMVVLGFIPAMALANIIARFVDTITDPLVANWSDRSQHPMGRRRIFMATGALPLAAVTMLVFFPPSDEAGVLNVAFLSVVLALYYTFFTVYVAPYLAMLPEIAPDKALNVRLATLMAAFALVGGLIAINVGGVMIASFGEATLALKQVPIQKTVLILGSVSLVLLLIPVLFVPERQLVQRTESSASEAGLIESVKKIMSDKVFLPYVFGYIAFAFGFNIVRSALPYIVTVLMREKSDSPAPIAVFGIAAVCFPLVGILAVKLGKRRVMIGGSLVMALAMASFFFVDDVTTGFIALAASGIGVSVFLAVPNAMLSDIANANALRTGERREAMFFGSQGFLLKINLGVSTSVLALLLEMGRSVGDDIGVRLSGPVAAVVLLGAAVCFWRYPEQRIMSELSSSTTPSTPSTT
jgi:GPH family glycoside/pentoside/hexuronide:cation symporter